MSKQYDCANFLDIPLDDLDILNVYFETSPFLDFSTRKCLAIDYSNNTCVKDAYQDLVT